MKFSPAFAAIKEKSNDPSKFEDFKKKINQKALESQNLKLKLKSGYNNLANYQDAIKILVLMDEIKKLGYTKNIDVIGPRLTDEDKILAPEDWKDIVGYLEELLYKLEEVSESKNEKQIQGNIQKQLELLTFAECTEGVKESINTLSRFISLGDIPTAAQKHSFFWLVTQSYAKETGIVDLMNGRGILDTHYVNNLLYSIRNKYNIKVKHAKYGDVKEYTAERFRSYLEKYLSSPQAVEYFAEQMIQMDVVFPELPNNEGKALEESEEANKEFYASLDAVMQSSLEATANLVLDWEDKKEGGSYKYKENYTKLLQAFLVEKFNSLGIIEGGGCI